MKYWTLVLLGIIAAALAGCGGGGGGSSSSGEGATIFITDDLNTGYDHVWATIKEVSLNKVGGGSVVVFSNPDGKSVDLRSLSDSNGKRFEFLVQTDRLNGKFNSVTVTLDDDVVLFPAGSETGLNRTFEGSVNGEKVLTATFPERDFRTDRTLIIDFDLSQWNDDGAQVTDAVIVVVTDPTVNDEERHARKNYPGFISNLQGSSPNQTFTLTRGNHSVQVQLDSETEVSQSGSGHNGNPVLQNGQHVVVRGVFNVGASAILADRVKITGDDEDEDDEDEALGTVSNIDVGAKSFDLDVIDADGFLPESNPIHVTTTANTSYRSRSGNSMLVADFFDALEDGDVVEVEGTYNAGTNTLVAVKVKFEDDDNDNARVVGATSSVDLALFRFQVVATSFTGINVAPGTLITVHTTESTEFRPLNGGEPNLTRDQFFAALTANPGELVEVEGAWDGTVLTASKVKLEDEID